MLIRQTVRVWFTDTDLSPEGDVWFHDLNQVVKFIVILPYQSENKTLADLAVHKHGVERVRRQYKLATFDQLGSRDPMVLAQKPKDLTAKRFEAHKQLRDTYEYARQSANRFDDQISAWCERRLRSILDGLDNIQNSVQVRPFPCSCAKH